MANAQVFESGYSEGIQRGGEARTRKEALSDKELQGKIEDLIHQRSAIVSKISSLDKDSPEYKQSLDALKQVNVGLVDAYHPQKNPNAIKSFGHLLTDHLGLTKPQPTDTMVVPKPKGLIAAGNINIWNRPTVQNADGSHSSEYSVSFQDDQGHEVLVPTVVDGKFLTPDGKKPPEGSPEEKAMFKAAWEHYLKTGQNLGKFANAQAADAYAQVLHARGNAPKGIVKQEAKTAKTAQEAATQALEEVAAGPLSPVQDANATAAATLASVQAAVKSFSTLNPDATDEEKQSFLTDLIQKAYGTTVAGNWKIVKGTLNGQPASVLFDSKTRQIRTLGGENLPPDLLATWVPETNTTEAANRRADFAQFQKDYKARNGKDYPGTFESWTAEQSAIGRTSIPKPQTADQQEQAILKKQALGQPLTPEEVASLKAYKEWIKIKTTDPKVAGYQALAWSRIQQVEVPGSPGETTYVPAGIAFKNQMHGPSSLSHLMTIYYGTGKGGQDLLRFNTATHHLHLMAQLGDALNNGNIQAVNHLSNEWKTQFLGEAAPTNFNAIRSAVAGELEKLYTQVGATQQGLADMKADVNNMQSPDQLNGYIDTALATMHGKIEASAQQYIMGTEGVPAFPEDIVAPPSNVPAGRGATPASPSNSTQYIYAKDPQGKVHRAKIGTQLPKGWTLTSAPTQK